MLQNHMISNKIICLPYIIHEFVYLKFVCTLTNSPLDMNILPNSENQIEIDLEI